MRLVLAGASNNYTGAAGTTISGGTLQVGNGGAGSLLLGPSSSPVVDNAALVYNQGTLTINNAISGSGAVANIGATGGLNINQSIALTNGNFALASSGAVDSGVETGIAGGVTLSVGTGVGTINYVDSGTAAQQFNMNRGVYNFSASGTGSINISSVVANNTGGQAGLALGSGTFNTTGNVNLYGKNNAGGQGIQIQESYATSVTANSGTTTITGDSYSGPAVMFAYGSYVSSYGTGQLVALTANPGAAIVFTGGASSGTAASVFTDWDADPVRCAFPTINVSGAVSFVSASTRTSSTFWAATGTAGWPMFNVASGGALTLDAGLSSMTNGIVVSSSGASATIAGSGTGTMSGAMTIAAGSLIYNVNGALAERAASPARGPSP